ncbi:UNVERIFIED_CONTAM: syntaxin [Sesamum latifolium]|uniref:Syntaxin n=1 Tax=Sesamum latifolium TaxID=2727402 RepID=A0AAW2SP29_9LAMI
MSVKSGNASIRDRTQEFLGIAERVKKSVSPQNGPTSSGSKREEPPRSAMAMQSEFNRRASKIGFGIHQTSQKLAKLAKLAKRTSVFDDPTMEIQELTAVIKQDITALNSANRLMSTTKEFKEVLTMRTENLKVHENRRQLFSSSASQNPSNPFVRQRPLAAKSAASNSAAPPLPWANGAQSSSQIFPKNQMDGESQPLLQQQQNQQQQQQQMVPLQDSYMQSRAEALQNVESTIHELSNIFNQLATLVSQQGEIAIRIDENMDDTLANVEGAQGALLNERHCALPNNKKNSSCNLDMPLRASRALSSCGRVVSMKGSEKYDGRGIMGYHQLKFYYILGDIWRVMRERQVETRDKQCKMDVIEDDEPLEA